MCILLRCTLHSGQKCAFYSGAPYILIKNVHFLPGASYVLIRSVHFTVVTMVHATFRQKCAFYRGARYILINNVHFTVVHVTF